MRAILNALYNEFYRRNLADQKFEGKNLLDILKLLEEKHYSRESAIINTIKHGMALSYEKKLVEKGANLEWAIDYRFLTPM